MKFEFLTFVLLVLSVCFVKESQGIKSDLRRFSINGLKELREMRKAYEEREREQMLMMQREQEKQRELDELHRRRLFRKILKVMGGVQASRFL